MTQKDRVLRHLEAGKTITPMEALIEYGTMALQVHIYKLRQEGFEIRSTLRTTLNKKRFAEYRLLGKKVEEKPVIKPSEQLLLEYKPVLKVGSLLRVLKDSSAHLLPIGHEGEVVGFDNRKRPLLKSDHYSLGTAYLKEGDYQIIG